MQSQKVWLPDADGRTASCVQSGVQSTCISWRQSGAFPGRSVERPKQPELGCTMGWRRRRIAGHRAASSLVLAELAPEASSGGHCDTGRGLHPPLALAPSPHSLGLHVCGGRAGQAGRSGARTGGSTLAERAAACARRQALAGAATARPSAQLTARMRRTGSTAQVGSFAAMPAQSHWFWGVFLKSTTLQKRCSNLARWDELLLFQPGFPAPASRPQ